MSRATELFKIYPSDTTVTLNTAPYDATYTAVTALQTKLLTTAVGCHVMEGWDGFEIWPYATTDDADMMLEIWLWYRIRDNTADPTYPNTMYLPILTWTFAVDILTGTYTGVAANYVPATALFCDTIAAHTNTAYATFLEKFYTGGLSNLEEYSPAGATNIPGCIKVPWCNAAHAIHVHIYEGSAGQSYGNGLMRFTRLPGND